MNKKGFLFTMLSVVTLVLMYIMLSGQIAFEQSQATPSLAGSASSATLLLGDIQQEYIHDIVAYSSFKTLQVITEKLNDSNYNQWVVGTHDSSTNRFHTVAAFQENFESVLIDGYIRPNNQILSKHITALFDNLSNQISQTGLFSMDISVVEDTVALYHEDPWHLRVHLTAVISVSGDNIFIDDAYVFAKAVVPIYNLLDPLVLLESDGLLHHYINQTNVTFTNLNTVDVTNLNTFVYQQAYHAVEEPHPGAPSFLQRFTNNLSAHPFGIESLFDHETISLLADETDLFAQSTFVNDTLVGRTIATPPLLTGSVSCRLNELSPRWYIYNVDGTHKQVVLDEQRMIYYARHHDVPSEDGLSSPFTLVCPNPDVDGGSFPIDTPILPPGQPPIQPPTSPTFPRP